ncbi:MAG TPA: ABC transporter ATP-binding protein [Micrococcaceae bacterium]
MIEAKGVAKSYRTRNRGSISIVHALRGIDLEIPDGGAVSIIGESGCGKTTLGRILAGMETASGGEIRIDGVSLASMGRKQRRLALQRIQLIHQDPYSALNPTRTVEAILTDPLNLRAKQTGRDQQWVQRRMHELLELVGLDAEYSLPRYPHQLSGGMRQRVVIARALTVDPEVLVADEAVSMIDVSLRLGILALLRRLRTELGVSVLFVTHDVATARYIGEDSRIYVLYRGTVVEQGLVDEVILRPVHPYTQSLLSAIPVLRGIEDQAPDLVFPVAPLDENQSDTGCLFVARCPFAHTECSASLPPLVLVPVDDGVPSSATPHRHACLFPEAREVIAVAGGAGAVA